MDSNREHEKESIDVESLITWSLTQPSLAAELANLTTDADGGLNESTSSPFRYRSDLNAKICLWIGDLTSLNAHAIVNSTNESLTDKNPISDAIFSKAGSRLKEEIFNNVQGCRTGNAVITKGYNLPARYIIHTVGPKYHVKYKTAAESSLYHCYRHVMELVREHRLSTVAIPTIHSVRRSYPPDEGAHIALRTVRRFLEQYGDTIQRFVFVVDSAEWSIYELLTPLYFPRSLLEERYALKHLPQDIGNQTGEPVIHDRRIRIIDNPQHSYLEESVDLASQLNSSVAVGSHAFAHMEDDVDKMRLLGGVERERPTTAIETLTQEAQRHERYERLLRRAKTEDLTEVSGIGCLYQSGVDKLGRPVIVFVGKWFKFSEINLDKALLYLIYLLDPIVKGDYVVVYFHTLTSSENHPSMSWIREVYNVLEYKHRKHLKSFYIVHPTIWTKIMTWWFTTFMAPAIKEKVHSVPGIEYLYSVIDMDQLEIPVFLTEYDMTVNGVRYYRPESDI